MTSFRWTNAQPTSKNFQRHHIIPVEIFSGPAHNKLFLSVRHLGFSPHDFATNGILLPSSESAAVQCRMPLHRGPHPRYNEMVWEWVDRITKVTKCDQSGAARLAQIRILQHYLRTQLHISNPLLCLNRRDPMRSNVNFDKLEKHAAIIVGQQVKQNELN